MRAIAFLGPILAFAASGCTHLALERNTLKQSATLTDLRYGQVLDNLAMLSCNPATLPYYSVISGGTAQVENVVSSNGGVTWGWAAPDGGSNSQTLGFMGQRSVSENWTLDPLHDPERLVAMRCVYQLVLAPAGC